MATENTTTRICPNCNEEKLSTDFIIARRVNHRCNRCHNALRSQKRKIAKSRADQNVKICKVCATEKNGVDFVFGTLTCKTCASEIDKEANHRPSESDPDKTCMSCNETKSALLFRKRELTCKECTKKKLYTWRENNKERFLEICKAYRDKDESKQVRNATARKKYRENIVVRLLQLYRNRVRDYIKQDYCPRNTHFEYEKLLGCSWNELVKWLESNMKPDMSWDNYGTYWHVDHITPCASFNFAEEENRRACFNWSNLAPLESIENLMKRDKIDTNMIQLYKQKAIEFIKNHPEMLFVTDSLPDDLQRALDDDLEF